MNEVLEAIRTRRSVKNYRAEPVPNDLLSEIVSAGTYAASGMNRQSPIILNITDRTARDMLSDLNRRVGGWQAGFDPFYGAPNVLCVLADKEVGTGDYEGIGFCILGYAHGEYPATKPRKENRIFTV